MSSYRATRSYRSNHNGRSYAFDEGDVSDVDDATAAWVNRDSPGTLEPADSDGPNVSDKKAVWVAYAESKGVVDADQYTKDELVAGAPDYDGFSADGEGTLEPADSDGPESGVTDGAAD